MATSSKTKPLALADGFTIYNALELKEKLLAELERTNEVELDLSQVHEIDTAGLQLLIMLKQEGQRRGKSVRITAHSQPVSEIIDFCHLGARFGDPLIIPARKAS